MLNQCNINSHSVKVQALIKKSGLPEQEVLKAIAQYGEDIQLDQLPRVNSEMFLKTALGCQETSKVVFASISDILDYTKTETIEDANIALNNEFRDLEIRLTALGSAAILDLKHRPTIFTKPKTNIPRTYIEQATKVYSKFPQLSYIGTAEEYAEYIQSIFKNSITRGTIYWHGTGTDFSDGFNSAIRGIGSGAPETKTRNDFYFAKQGETVLQYIPKLNVPEGLSRNDRKELCWNNLWWELKEILGNGKSLTDETWRNKVITELPTKIPNKHGIFNRDSGGSNGTYLTERKNHYRLNTPSGEVTLGFMSDAEFLDLFGFELGKDSFNSWTLRNYLKFAELFDSEYQNIQGVYPAIVNVHKGKAVTEFNQATNYTERGVFDKVKETHAEAVISDSANNEFGSDVLIMTNIGKTAEELKNNNKIHWLGSKQDIEEFKNWKNRKQYNSDSGLEQIRKQAIADGRIVLKADGTFDYALAPNNKKSNLTERQWLQVRTKDFIKWFGDWENDPKNASKVVDENGEPLVVYHGGKYKKGEKFSVFDVSKSEDRFWLSTVVGDKSFFTNNDYLAYKMSTPDYYQREVENLEGSVYEVFLNLKNPLVLNAEGKRADFFIDEHKQELKDNEEIIVNNIDEDGINVTDYIISNSNQIKSATDNVGTFSEENDDISDSTISKLGLSELTKGQSNNFTKVLLRDVTDKLRNLYGIQINLVTTEELKSEQFKGVIANPHLTKGFILDGQIYINADTASLDTPIHELLHMFLGGIKYSNPTLYFKLVSSVEQLPLYPHYLETGTMTRGDLNEELFVEEFAKYIVRRPSLFDSIDAKDLDTLQYDINRVLDSFFMGEASFQKSDVRNTFTKSIQALADQYGSDILNIKDSIDSARLHRQLANEKSDLLNNGELEEICE